MTDSMIAERGPEAGFTLVEALVSIVVLAFGLIAVTNLLIVAASSNTVGNFSTAATAIASQQMDILKAQKYTDLSDAVTLSGLSFMGDVDADLTNCTIAGYPSGTGYSSGDCFRVDTIPGVGVIHTRFQVSRASLESGAGTDHQVLFIRVRSEGTGVLARARSRAEFTAFRSCTNIPKGCPPS